MNIYVVLVADKEDGKEMSGSAVGGRRSALFNISLGHTSTLKQSGIMLGSAVGGRHHEGIAM